MRAQLVSIAKYLAYTGCVGIIIGLSIWLIGSEFDRIAVLIPLFAGVLLLGIYAVMRPSDVLRAVSGRQAKYGSNMLLMVVAFAGILIFVNYLANQYHARWDVTEDSAYSLSPQTIQIIKGLDEPVSITGFFSSKDTRKVVIQDLLDEYRFCSDSITYELVDPDLKPSIARQYGVSSSGVLVLDYGEKRQTISPTGEQGLTSAILRLTRDEEKAIYFLTGHKERDPQSNASDGYSMIGARLANDGYRVGMLNLSALSGAVPENAAALIVAGSQITFTETERNLFIDYLYNGGKALMMFDPGANNVDHYMLDDWGIRVRNDLIVDPPSSFFGDIGTPLISQYPDHQITRNMRGVSTYFAYARSLEVVNPAPANVDVDLLAQTSSASWGETKITRDMQVQYDEGQDTLGPLNIGIAVEEHTMGGRLVVFGDTDFVTNGVLSSAGGEFGNAEFFMNTINWLTEEDYLIAIRPKQVESRQMILASPQLRLILYSSVILLPLAVLAMGIATWWANR